ncbi:hypothetical protein QQ045_016888 [Rhodiola kirilowii]
MSLLTDPTIKLFGKTIPLSSSLKLPAAEFAGGVQFEVVDDGRSSKEEVGDFDGKKHVVEVDADDYQGESAHRGLRDDGSVSSGIVDMEGSVNEGLQNGDDESSTVAEGKSLKRPDKIVQCPRCNSMETKFCYYNNYNVKQPRHFCKKCQRYWTAGGSMRNVPIGSGRRKSKSLSSYVCRQVVVNEATMQSDPCTDSNGVLRFGSDPPLRDSVASFSNLADDRENYCQYQNPDKRIHMVGNRVAGQSNLNSSDSHLTEKGNNESRDALNNFQGYHFQVPCYPGPMWPIPWIPVVQPPHMGLAGYPVSCYSMMGSIHPNSTSLPSKAPTKNSSSSSPNLTTLGKHSRDGKIVNAPNLVDKVAPKASSGIWIPKTLRIKDPNEAAKSSIWKTLGIQNEKSSIKEGGIFKSFPSTDGIRGNYKVPERPCHLYTNPAALSRSQNFHESTSMKHTST